MSQHENVVEVFSNFIKEIKPNRIIEIGTYTGGFIVALKDILEKHELNCDVITYDIIERNVYSKIRSNGIDVVIKNIFNKTYDDLNESYKDEIISSIQDEGVTLILCDGGNKISEFKILSQFLKSGDFIMAHDYAESLEVFNKNIKNKIWNWCEIVDSDIESTCNKNNLHSFMHDEFKSVVWVCKQKGIANEY